MRARFLLYGYAGGDTGGFRDLAADCVTRIQA
jgi:hypothetical protein